MARKAKKEQIERHKKDCLTNLRFADDVLLFSTSLNKLEEMRCDLRRNTESVGLGIHPSKNEDPQQPSYGEEKRSYDRQHQDRSSAQKKECARYVGQKLHSRNGNGRSQDQTESGIGSIPQIPTRAYLESISPMPQITLVQPW